MNLAKLPKAEIVYMASNRCQHRHTYLEHPQCYVPQGTQRLAFFDLECSNLNADFGYILSWAIYDGTNARHDVLTPADLKRAKAGNEDGRLVRSCLAELAKYDRIVTFYGKRFDVPFLRTRAMCCGVPFPEYGFMCHTDVYDIVKHKLKLSSNRQENACRVVLGSTEKTRIEPRYWRAAARGDVKSLKYVLEHNLADVRDLERLYRAVVGFVKETKTSA